MGTGKNAGSQKYEFHKAKLFWQDIDLKNNSHLIWFFNWCKDRPTIFLNIIHGTIQQLTENNESESVLFTLTDFHGFAFASMNFLSWYTSVYLTTT